MKAYKLIELNKLAKKDYNGIIKLIPTNLYEYCLQNELPIKNIEIVIKNLSDFLSHIMIKYDSCKNPLITITANEFINYFSRDKYNKYKEILSETKILTQIAHPDGTYYDKDNGISKLYRLHNSFLNEIDFTILIFKNKNKDKDFTLDPKVNVDIKYLNTILNEELDYEKVILLEHKYYNDNDTTLFSLYSRLSRALSLNKSRYIKKGVKVNRIYHSFSNLSKVTRKCFKTKFNNIDLTNSQPILLVYYLLSNEIKFENEYQTICENGKFYELFYDLYEDEFKTITDDEVRIDKLRKKVKISVYQSLFFAFNESRRINKRFKELFPIIWNVLKELNNKNVELAGILQNIEAEIFNNIKLKYSNKYFVLFDAIYFNDVKDKSFIEKQIIEAGNKFNIKITTTYN